MAASCDTASMLKCQSNYTLSLAAIETAYATNTTLTMMDLTNTLATGIIRNYSATLRLGDTPFGEFTKQVPMGRVPAARHGYTVPSGTTVL